jgi:proteic killer suppression protein
MMQTRVKIEDKLLDKVARMPPQIGRKLAFWIEAVAHEGLEEVRKIPGYHDEPLRGDRAGQRSIRLNKAYRAIYIEVDGEPVVVEIIEVSKHKY